MDVGGSGAILPKLLPGGVTIVLPRSPKLNPALNPGFETVGVRVPDHEFVLSLCAAVGGPIALTSANISNGPNSTSIEVCIYFLKFIYPTIVLSITNFSENFSEISHKIFRPDRNLKKSGKI